MRMAISLMGRTELHTTCDNRDLNSLNREFSVETWPVSSQQDFTNEYSKPMQTGIKENMLCNRAESMEKVLPGILNLIFNS